MDYIIGFLFGYFLKELGLLINRISIWDYDNRYGDGYEFDINDPISEDDLP